MHFSRHLCYNINVMSKKLNIQKFIEQHPDWEQLLSEKPYCLNITKDTFNGQNLVMFKYNQIDSDFSIPLVKEARGLILDADTNEIISFPFTKFFNFGETNAAEIDWKSASILKKVDGCVRSDTLIKTTVGDISIKDICKNPNKYEVLTYNHTTNKIESNSIDAISIKNDINSEWYEIELIDSTKLIVTGNHKIWCENLHCYRRVDELDGTEELIVK